MSGERARRSYRTSKDNCALSPLIFANTRTLRGEARRTNVGWAKAPDGSCNCAPMSSAVPTRTLTPRSVFAARPDVGTISAFYARLRRALAQEGRFAHPTVIQFERNMRQQASCQLVQEQLCRLQISGPEPFRKATINRFQHTARGADVAEAML